MLLQTNSLNPIKNNSVQVILIKSKYMVDLIY